MIGKARIISRCLWYIVQKFLSYLKEEGGIINHIMSEKEKERKEKEKWTKIKKTV